MNKNNIDEFMGEIAKQANKINKSSHRSALIESLKFNNSIYSSKEYSDLLKNITFINKKMSLLNKNIKKLESKQKCIAKIILYYNNDENKNPCLSMSIKPLGNLFTEQFCKISEDDLITKKPTLSERKNKKSDMKRSIKNITTERK